MDANETLRIIRALIRQMAVEHDTRMRGGPESPEFLQHALDLAEHVEALDGWLTRGGFPPAAWLEQPTGGDRP